MSLGTHARTFAHVKAGALRHDDSALGFLNISRRCAPLHIISLVASLTYFSSGRSFSWRTAEEVMWPPTILNHEVPTAVPKGRQRLEYEMGHPLAVLFFEVADYQSHQRHISGERTNAVCQLPTKAGKIHPFT